MQLFSPTGSRTLGRKILRPRSAELCPAANTLPYLCLQKEILGVSRGYRIWDEAGENDVMCLCDRSLMVTAHSAVFIDIIEWSELRC